MLVSGIIPPLAEAHIVDTLVIDENLDRRQRTLRDCPTEHLQAPGIVKRGTFDIKQNRRPHAAIFRGRLDAARHDRNRYRAGGIDSKFVACLVSRRSSILR